MTSKNRQFSVILLALAASLATASASAIGQLGNGGTTYSSIEQTRDRSIGFMPRFVELTHAGAAAQATLLSTLGLADDAKRTAAISDSLVAESTPGTVDTVLGSAGEAQRLVLQKLAAGPVLNDAAKAQFASAALELARTAKGYAELTANFGDMKQALRAAGAPGRTALYAAKTMPQTVTQMREALQAVLVFSKANGIALAAEVNETVAAM
jgi:hypothetical protein